MSNPLSALGFLTVLEDAENGFFGGYLVLSEWGRPLEFLCSTPVLPNQAQKILYGSTLRSYVLGDLIGQTLLAKSQLPVLAVLTDLPDMLSLAYLREEILACIELDMKSELEVDKQSGASIQIGPHRLTGGADCQWPSHRPDHDGLHVCVFEHQIIDPDVKSLFVGCVFCRSGQGHAFWPPSLGVAAASAGVCADNLLSQSQL